VGTDWTVVVEQQQLEVCVRSCVVWDERAVEVFTNRLRMNEEMTWLGSSRQESQMTGVIAWESFEMIICLASKSIR